MRSLFIAAIIVGLSVPALALDDEVTLGLTLDTPSTGYYQLAGQSAYMQQQTSAGTSGGQLDGKTSPGDTIIYTEVFPPTNLSDYLTFSYFGLVQTYDQNNVLLDTSLVAAFQPGVAVGQTFDSFFPPGDFIAPPGIEPTDEASIVTALSTLFDSEIFESLGSRLPQDGSTSGTIGLPQLAVVGDTLDLIAFIGGANGDEGVKIGTLNTNVERIPEPTTLAALGLIGLATGLRRRR